MTATPDPCEPVEVTAADGASFRVYPHGGHVAGWVPAGGTDRLWCSRDTGCGPGTAIRGGVPIIWPQFSDRGDGPRHGVARDRAWDLLEVGRTADGAAHARLRLVCGAGDTPLGHAFTLELDGEAEGSSLVLTLVARNDGDTPLTTTAAFHTYLRVSSTATTAVVGLDGMLARPNGGGAPWHVTGPLDVVGPIDVAVEGVPAGDDGVVVVDDGSGDAVSLTADGVDSRVVWNPGPGKAPADVHPGGEGEFVCVEPALLEPRTLAPGGVWRARQVLVAGRSASYR
ncbi:aldose epimerase family protein [Aquipuribacter sp. SD81]|uniref:aldose epimerase family protein n=1 Tax=Aquipuribacter sp. SD81 TaxID=3127703 RepID=UPI003018F715